jgi:hypothetical protein
MMITKTQKTRIHEQQKQQLSKNQTPNNPNNNHKQEEIEPPGNDTQKSTARNTKTTFKQAPQATHKDNQDTREVKSTTPVMYTAPAKNTSELPKNVTDPSKHNKNTDDQDAKNTAEKTNTTQPTKLPKDSEMTTENDPSKHNKITDDQDAKNTAEKTNTTKPTNVPKDSEMTTKTDPFITVKKENTERKKSKQNPQ